MSVTFAEPVSSRAGDRMIRSVAAVGWAVAMMILTTGNTLAASPTPGVGGDPRSAGEGPGLMGDPVFAIIGVVAIGIGALVLTLAFIRLTGGRTR